MSSDYWLRQDEPLFPDIEWSKPETKAKKGKLLVVGGSSHGFMSVGKAFTDCIEAGAGEVKVVLPDAVQRMIVDKAMPIEFAASTPAGSFSSDGIDSILSYANWADAIYLAGEFGRNSETQVLLHSIAKKTKKLLLLTKDSVDYFYTDSKDILERDNTILAASLSQLQKILISISNDSAIKFDMNLMDMIDILHDLTEKYPISIVTFHNQNILVANGGFVSSTKYEDELLWQQDISARAIVYAMQHPTQQFEAISSSLVAQ